MKKLMSDKMVRAMADMKGRAADMKGRMADMKGRLADRVGRPNVMGRPDSGLRPMMANFAPLSQMMTKPAGLSPMMTKPAALPPTMANPNTPQFSNKPFPMKKGGSVKKYAGSGSVSSASKRADGIAHKGKTKGKMV